MLLYRDDLVAGDIEDAIASYEADNGCSIPSYTEQIVRGVLERRDALDAVIAEYLEEWTVERLGTVERAVLRVAMWELFESDDVPGPVAIDEAVELAKRYATPEAAKLINGVLASWLRDHEAKEAGE